MEGDRTFSWSEVLLNLGVLCFTCLIIVIVVKWMYRLAVMVVKWMYRLAVIVFGWFQECLAVMMFGWFQERRDRTLQTTYPETYDTDDPTPNYVSRLRLGHFPDISLTCQLERYYRDVVDISPYKMSAAQQVVDYVVDRVQERLENTWPDWNFGALKQVGSTVEGLKVFQPDEFDFMIPIGLERAMWTFVAASQKYSAPGFWYIHKLLIPQSAFEDATFVDRGCLSPARARRAFQGALHRMASYNNAQNNFYKINPSVQGPSISLTVFYGACRQESLSIDFVPTVTNHNQRYLCDLRGEVHLVGKPHPLSERGYTDYDVLWRRSFSEEELLKVREADKSFIKCLKILKTIRIHNTHLKMLSSYVLKTLLLHSMDKYGCSHSRDIGELFTLLVKELVAYLGRQELPHYFTPDGNLFAEYSPESLTNLENYLKYRLGNLDVLLSSAVQSV